MAEPAANKPKVDLSQNKANVMLRKAAEGKYAIPGVCVVSLPRGHSQQNHLTHTSRYYNQCPPTRCLFP